MNLDLKSIQYVVFDEADRLFEMGFETALNEIIHRLPATRQTLLFSATLPKSLVEFSKAGLQNPELVRLDSENKISADLKMAFFSVKQAEKDACLLTLLRDVIKIPLRATENPPSTDKKGKGITKGYVMTAPHQTIIFTATKHHVEYLTSLLTTAGYSVSHLYGSLDQGARSQQMELFRRGKTSLLVVTDIAARGIDIPVLENVVNYDFPHGSRVFVHRVGRTARAGRQGWAWSFVTNPELPYLLDLQMFLGRPLKAKVPPESGEQVYTESLILGPFDRSQIDSEVEFVKQLEIQNHSLPSLREVMKRGHQAWERTKGKGSDSSYKKAKEVINDLSGDSVHPVLLMKTGAKASSSADDEARQALLRAVSSFRPAETVFETGAKKGNTANAQLMRERRRALERAQTKPVTNSSSANLDLKDDSAPDSDVEMADEEDIAVRYLFGCLSLFSQSSTGCL
jgi:ATP-dependent RNA helicase DDX54/DBP10